MSRRTFNLELLLEALKRDEASSIGEYDKLNRESIISFRCNCGENYEKRFRYIKENGGAKCKTCTETLRLKKIKETNIEKYGVENGHSKEVKEKIKETSIEKYGVEHPLQSELVKDKGKATNIIKYGVEHPTQSSIVKEKTTSTNLLKYGVTNPNKTKEVREKINKTNIIKYGVENPSQVEDFKEKKKITSMKHYGVEYPQQSKEIQEKTQKNAKKFKEFKFPSGIIRKVQGYEPFALEALLKAGYTEAQIITERKDVPRITYEIDKKKKYYFPDISIPHENKIIEVKSTWTCKIRPDIIELKKNACLDAGYLYETWCYDNKGGRVDV